MSDFRKYLARQMENSGFRKEFEKTCAEYEVLRALAAREARNRARM